MIRNALLMEEGHILEYLPEGKTTRRKKMSKHENINKRNDLKKCVWIFPRSHCMALGKTHVCFMRIWRKKITRFLSICSL